MGEEVVKKSGLRSSLHFLDQFFPIKFLLKYCSFCSFFEYLILFDPFDYTVVGNVQLPVPVIRLYRYF